MVSRRAVLAGSAGLTGVALGAGIATRVPLGDVGSWSPGPDTWPLRRFDPANGATNRDGDPPGEPSVAWTANPLPTGYPPALVVGENRVYAAAGGRVAALDRAAGRERWTVDGGSPVALRDDALYAAPGDQGAGRDDPRTLRALDPASGEERWTATTEAGGTTLSIAADVLLFGGEFGLESFDPSTGRRRWVGSTFREAVPLVHDGRLYAASGLFDGAVGRYRPRRLTDPLTGTPPTLAWRADRETTATGLTAARDAVVAGFRAEAGEGDALVCFDRGSGEIRWSEAAPAGDAVEVRALATDGDACVAGIRGTGRVVSRRLDDGSVRWRFPPRGRVTDLVGVGEAVIVGLSTGTVLALDAADGSERWRADAGVTPAVLGAVDGAVFAASPGGQVVALR